MSRDRSATAAHHAVPGVTAYVGGETSSIVDMRTAMNHDYKVIFPVAGLLIALILLVLLRSVVAPLVLLASVSLGFAATMGSTVIAFQIDRRGVRHPVLHPHRHLPVRGRSRDRL